MRHSIRFEGYGLRLRPVNLDDAEFIIGLRNHPRVRGNVGDTVPDAANQRDWIQTYFDREGDYYFIVETAAGLPVGTIGIYEAGDGVAQWGRWIILPEEQLPALPSAVLIHQVAFDFLKLKTLVGAIVSTNQKVLDFHKRFGAEFTHVEAKSRLINGEWNDMVWIRIQKTNWPAIFARLEPIAEAVGRSIKLSSGKVSSA